MYNVLIADDHPLFRSALKVTLSGVEEDISLEETGGFKDTLQQLVRSDMDMLLLDLKMPDSEGLLGLIKLRSRFPQLAIVVISANEDPQIIKEVKAAGALAYINKSTPLEEIQSIISSVLKGNCHFPKWTSENTVDTVSEKIAQLTPQQFRVLTMIAKGDLNKQIAYQLNVKESTVKTHISEIFKKLGIINRTQAALFVQPLELNELH
ncbi:Response regulator [Marinomonas sp. MED121]|uniref:response regulator transcription factor n=1 Tax=Marinomonas sp. MED121 TaxID=314277 RepID=UPI00006910D9|nr:response regulator transcription factor [Marinomonas sp. MED121]EAQ67337.1 Response regulator [Marinomonas sp. MED121]